MSVVNVKFAAGSLSTATTTGCDIPYTFQNSGGRTHFNLDERTREYASAKFRGDVRDRVGQTTCRRAGQARGQRFIRRLISRSRVSDTSEISSIWPMNEKNRDESIGEDHVNERRDEQSLFGGRHTDP